MAGTGLQAFGFSYVLRRSFCPPLLMNSQRATNDRSLRAIELVWYSEQPDKDPRVQVAGEEYERSKIRDPSGLVVSQVPHDEELRKYEH